MSNRARGHSRARTAAAAFVAGITFTGAAGCTPDITPADSVETPLPTPDVDEAVPTPTPTAASTSPGMVAALPDGERPARPSGLDEPPTAQAAGAIAQFFVQLYPYAQNTLDVTDLRALSHPDCAFCSSAISTAEQHRSRDEHVEGGGLELEPPSVQEVDLGRWYHVTFAMTEEPSRVVSKTGTVVDDDPGKKSYDVDVVVLYEDATWRIRGLSYAPTTAP